MIIFVRSLEDECIIKDGYSDVNTFSVILRSLV